MAIFQRLRKRRVDRQAGDAGNAAGAPGAPAAPGPRPAPKTKVAAPRPRRSDYKGNRLQVFVWGRAGEPGPAGAGAVPAPGPQDAACRPCASCGARTTSDGGLCERCAVQARLVETENLLSSLRAKGIDVATAETCVHQARVALALDTLRDVEELCERAAAAARKTDSEHDVASETLSECERTIAGLIERGKDTSAAQAALEQASALFRRGEYAAASALAARTIEEAEAPAGGAAAGAGREASGRPPQPVVRSAEPGTRRAPPETPQQPTPYSLYECPAPSDEPGKCANCGEPLEADWNSCPNCSALIRGGVQARNCPSCGRELLPDWRVCPYCDTELPAGDRPGPARSRWQRRSAAETATPKVPPEVRERELLEYMERTKKMLGDARSRGLDVTKAQNLQDLAGSFARSRNYDKGERYARKARNVAETVLS